MKLEGYMPEHTTDDAIQAMSHYVLQDYRKKEITSLAERITKGINPNDQTSTMLAISNWVYCNLKYVKDGPEAHRLFGTQEEDLEMVKSPIATLESRRYDCDCGSTLIAALLLAVGIQARFVTVAFHVPGQMEHVFAQGYDELKNEWIVLDPVSHPKEAKMIQDTIDFRVYSLDGGINGLPSYV